MDPGVSLPQTLMSSSHIMDSSAIQSGEGLSSKELNLYRKELELMNLERALLNKQGVLIRREAAVNADAEMVKQEKEKMREAKAVMELQRALLAKEQRTFDRKELMGWVSESKQDDRNGQCSSKTPRSTAVVGRKRRLWEVLNVTMLEEGSSSEDSTKERRLDASNNEDDSVECENQDFQFGMPLGIEENAVNILPEKVSLSSPFLTEPEYNLLLDVIKSFQQCSTVRLRSDVYERLLPEACLAVDQFKDKYLSCIRRWNSALEKKDTVHLVNDQEADEVFENFPLKVLGFGLLQTAFASPTEIPMDFIQVFEVTLNIALLICWQGDHKLLRKALLGMSAIASVLSYMLWEGQLWPQDILVQLNVFISKTIASVGADEKLNFSAWAPANFKDLFVNCTHFPLSFLHPPILSRDDTTEFLLKLIKAEESILTYLIGGLFDLFVENLDRALPVKTLIKLITNNIIKILRAPKSQELQEKSMEMLLGKDCGKEAGLLDGLCDVRSSFHRWNLLYLGMKVSGVYKDVMGEEFVLREAERWERWASKSSCTLAGGCKKRIVCWLEEMVVLGKGKKLPE